MASRAARFSIRCPEWLVALGLMVAIALVLVVGASRRTGEPREAWTALLGMGDELAMGRLTATLAGQPLTARKAYLLAFHEAQDAGDVERAARRTVGEQYDALFVAGGDGTLNIAIRALLETGSPSLPIVGVVPFGTGNDFVKSLGLGEEPLVAVDRG